MSELETAMKKLRRKAFGGDWPLDADLTAIGARYPSHRFLQNPSGQYPLLYLTHFVKLAAEQHFQKSFGTLSLLDWGCGKGHITKLIGDLKPGELTSCDIVSDWGDSAFGQDVPIHQQFGISVVPLVHESTLPFTNDSFDIVLSFGVLEHVANDKASLREIARVLKPQGLFFCFHLPTRFSWTQFVARRQGDNYHNRLYTPHMLKRLLSENNMRILDMWYRSLLPKNRISIPSFRAFERFDQIATEYTPMRYLATNLEFVASMEVKT